MDPTIETEKAGQYKPTKKCIKSLKGTEQMYTAILGHN